MLKLFVSKRAMTGGMTMADARSVTPRICMDTTMVAASISEKRVSIQPVGTP